MIKKCKVILTNSEVTVIDFDGKQVQLSVGNITDKSIYIKYDRTYTIVTEKEYQEFRNREFIANEEPKKIIYTNKRKTK